jgi:hypothetical protein
MGEYYWVVLEGNLIFSLIPVFIYWGMRRNIKKNIEYFRNYLLGGYPRNVFNKIFRRSEKVTPVIKKIWIQQKKILSLCCKKKTFIPLPQ